MSRDLNQKLFPILSISEMTDDFYQMFTENETGFAFLAFHNDTLVGGGTRTGAVLYYIVLDRHVISGLQIIVDIIIFSPPRRARPAASSPTTTASTSA